MLNRTCRVFFAGSVKELNIIVNRIADVAAVVAFEPIHYPDERVLLGYVLHFLATNSRNVKMYEGRDGCGGDNWRVEDVNKEDNNKHLTAFMAKLQPNTQYAYYVKTYTIASEKVGGQSRIYYLKTRPAQPEPVQKLTTTVETDSSLTVTWQRPFKVNGDLIYYVVTAEILKEHTGRNTQSLDRNYCDNRESKMFIQIVIRTGHSQLLLL